MATVVSPLLINHHENQQQQGQQGQTQAQIHPIHHFRSQSPQTTQSRNRLINVKPHQGKDVESQSEYQDEYESHTEQPRPRPRPPLPVDQRDDVDLVFSPHFNLDLHHDQDHDQDHDLDHDQSQDKEEETPKPPSTPLNAVEPLNLINPNDNEESSLPQDISTRLSYLALSLPITPQAPEIDIDQRLSRYRGKPDDTPSSNGSRGGRRGRSSSVSLLSNGGMGMGIYSSPHAHAQQTSHHSQGRWRSSVYPHAQALSSAGHVGSNISLASSVGVTESTRKQGRHRGRARSQLFLPAAASTGSLPVIEVDVEVLHKTAPAQVVTTLDYPDKKDEESEYKEKPSGFGIDFSRIHTHPTQASELERGRGRTNVTILEVPDSPPISLEEGGFGGSSASEWSGTTSEDEGEDDVVVKKREDKELTVAAALMDDHLTPRNSSITPGKREKRVRMGSRVRFEHLQHHHSPSPHSLVHHTSPATRDKLFDPYTATISTLTHLLQSSLITSTQIIETYLSQINLHNSTLRALTWVREREDVLREARVCDLYRSRGWVDWERKPLWGVPIVVKDNIATDEELGMPTTAGSFALLGMPVKKDAFIVRKLREAGAIILAKANMSELADYKSAHAGAGWSAVGGQTINVYAAHASPGTSSSGNGVSVAAGFCPASIGTETDGSITLPCLQSCLYGLKPTVGMLSRSGVVPFAPYFDTPGPMAKDVKSLAILMDVMCARDDEDVKTLEVDRIPRGVKYVDSCDAPSFEGLRIGIPRANWHNIDPWRRPGRDELVPEIANPFQQVIEMMAMHGATVQDPADIPSAVDGSLWECSSGSRSMVVAADCNHYLGKYLQNLGGSGGCRSVADIIAFNEEHADIEMPPGHHGQEVLKRCLDAVSVDSDEYARAKADMKLVAGKRGLDAVMDEYDLDALFMIREGHHSAANMVGYPIAAVPIGVLSDNTPYGAFFIGRKHGEQALLRVMAAWEATFPSRPLPPIATVA